MNRAKRTIGHHQADWDALWESQKEEREREKEVERIFEKMAENSPNSMKESNLPIQEVQQTSSRPNSKRTTPRHHNQTVKRQKSWKQHKRSDSSRKGIFNKINSSSHQKPWKPKGSQMPYLKS